MSGRRQPKRSFLVEVEGTQIMLRVEEWPPMAGGHTWAAEFLFQNGHRLPGLSGRTMEEAIDRTVALHSGTRGRKRRLVGGAGGRA